MLARLAGNRELMLAMTTKPANDGFLVKDSFFSDHQEELDYDPQNGNPNKGFLDGNGILAHVYKKQNLSIDNSPENSSVHDEHDIMSDKSEKSIVPGGDDDDKVEVWVDDGP